MDIEPKASPGSLSDIKQVQPKTSHDIEHKQDQL